MDLERDLSTLAIAWPETPAFRLELAPRRSRRPLLAAAALAAAALAAAFAVPQSRGAILRFLHLGGVTIESVERLPAAQERPLAAGLGPVVTLEAAEHVLQHRLLLPALDPAPPLHLASGRVVSLVFADRGRPVLLSELPSEGSGLLKKIAAGGTLISPVRVARSQGLWLARAAHVYVFPGAPPRLAGNVLLWQRGGITLRLEGRGLSETDALSLARRIP